MLGRATGWCCPERSPAFGSALGSALGAIVVSALTPGWAVVSDGLGYCSVGGVALVVSTPVGGTVVVVSYPVSGVIDVSAGAGVVGAAVVSTGAAMVVSAGWVTAVVSPRSGAAPVSSSDLLWHAARVAAAARIQRVFICSLLVATNALPAKGFVADVRQPRACLD